MNPVRKIARASLTCIAISLVTYAHAEERPNILWLTVEDVSPYAFGCYGNTDVKTPNIDRLAETGIQFTNAYSNAPQCSPARGTIISGNYATHYGTDQHRLGMTVPQERYFFPQHVREADYFTTNNRKQDYNADKTYDTWITEQVWTLDGNRASYNDTSRKPDQPFFSVFNNFATHMTRLVTLTTEGRPPFRIDPDSLELPPHVPDLPEMRNDFALHLEGAEDIDKWVGLFLDNLKKRNLADDTIIFFFSDHGGCLPRGKAFPYDTGMRVPLIVYAPPKWVHLLNAEVGSKDDRLVAFVDLAPTVLSLIGKEKKPWHAGRAFLGKHTEPSRDYNFGFRTNTGEHYDPSRVVFDGRFQYIRCFTPHKPHALRQRYQWQMPSQMAWHRAFNEGKLSPEHQRYYQPKPTEMLFDLEADPWQLNNLAEHPDYQKKLSHFRNTLRQHLKEIQDLGFFPRTVKASHGNAIWEWVQANDYPVEELIDAAFLASEANPKNLPQLKKLLQHERPEMRFWGASGAVTLLQRELIKSFPGGLQKAMQDTNPEVATLAAEAVSYLEPELGFKTLFRFLEDDKKGKFTASSLEGMSPRLKGKEETLVAILERKKKSGVARSIRSLLINLGRLEWFEYYSKEEWAKGKERAQRTLNWRSPGP